MSDHKPKAIYFVSAWIFFILLQQLSPVFKSAKSSRIMGIIALILFLGLVSLMIGLNKKILRYRYIAALLLIFSSFIQLLTEDQYKIIFSKISSAPLFLGVIWLINCLCIIYLASPWLKKRKMK